MISAHILYRIFLNETVLIFFHIIKRFHLLLSYTNNSIFSHLFANSLMFLVLLCISMWRCSWCNGYCRRKWTRVQFLDQVNYISHSTNTLRKGMNPIILLPAMGKIVGQTRFFSLGEATSLGERKL